MTATCRSCGAPVLWAVTDASRRIPLDPAPVDGGNVLLEGYAYLSGNRVPRAVVVGKAVQPNLFGDDSPRYVSHFATCPQADKHRQVTR